MAESAKIVKQDIWELNDKFDKLEKDVEIIKAVVLQMEKAQLAGKRQEVKGRQSKEAGSKATDFASVEEAITMERIEVAVKDKSQELRKEKDEKLCDKAKKKLETKMEGKDAVADEKEDKKKPVEQEEGENEPTAEQQLKLPPFLSEEQFEVGFGDNPREKRKTEAFQALEATKTASNSPREVRQMNVAAEEVRVEMKRGGNVEETQVKHKEYDKRRKKWAEAEDSDTEKEHQDWVVNRVEQVKFGRSPKLIWDVVFGPVSMAQSSTHFFQVTHVPETQNAASSALTHSSHSAKIDLNRGTTSFSSSAFACYDVKKTEAKPGESKASSNTTGSSVKKGTALVSFLLATYSKPATFLPLFGVDAFKRKEPSLSSATSKLLGRLSHLWGADTTARGKEGVGLYPNGLFRSGNRGKNQQTRLPHLLIITKVEEEVLGLSDCALVNSPLRHSGSHREIRELAHYNGMFEANSWHPLFEHFEASERPQVKAYVNILFVCFVLVGVIFWFKHQNQFGLAKAGEGKGGEGIWALLVEGSMSTLYFVNNSKCDAESNIDLARGLLYITSEQWYTLLISIIDRVFYYKTRDANCFLVEEKGGEETSLESEPQEPPILNFNCHLEDKVKLQGEGNVRTTFENLRKYMQRERCFLFASTLTCYFEERNSEI